jgi:hypothetical protein
MKVIIMNTHAHPYYLTPMFLKQGIQSINNANWININATNKILSPTSAIALERRMEK